MILRYSQDEDTLGCFQNTLEICNGIPSTYFAAPPEVEGAEQPDQILQTEEPTAVAQQEPVQSETSDTPSEDDAW